MIEFTVPVKPATKKNSGQIVMRGKDPVLLPSKTYLKFEKDCLPYFIHVRNAVGLIGYPVNIECRFFTESKRKIDLPNLLNAVDDAMVKAGLILDDNRDIVAGHDNSRVYHDKFNPRIEIKITPIVDYPQWNDTTTKQERLFE